MKKVVVLLLIFSMALSLSSCYHASAAVVPVDDSPSTPFVAAASAQEDSWELILVNAWHNVPPHFTVELTRLNWSHSFDSRAYPYLQQMLEESLSSEETNT